MIRPCSISRYKHRIKAASLLVLGLVIVAVACDQSKDADTGRAKAQNAPTNAAVEEPDKKLSFPPNSGPPPAIDANRAMQYVKEIVAFGPPEAVVKEKRSYTGAFLKPVLGRRRVERKRRTEAAE